MTRNRYEALKNDYGRYASWAVWGEDVYDPSVIERAVPSLHARFVFIGLSASRDLADKAPWSNYHLRHPGSREKIFAPILGAEPFGGAYMTDIVKDCAASTAAEVLAFLKNNPDALDRNVKILAGELAALGTVGAVILIGRDAQKIWRKCRPPARYTAYPLTHFSAFGRRFPDSAPGELRKIAGARA